MAGATSLWPSFKQSEVSGRLVFLCAVFLVVHGLSRRRIWTAPSLPGGGDDSYYPEIPIVPEEKEGYYNYEKRLWSSNSSRTSQDQTETAVARQPVPVEATEGSPVAVWVYLESLCIDSRRFVLQQLVPTYAALGNRIMELELVVFGNAQLDEEQRSVTCQHGTAECDANTYEQCAISVYPYPSMYLPYVACLFEDLTMGHREEPFNAVLFDACARSAALDAFAIRACHDDPREAWLLQKDAERWTRPTGHTFVPWVTVHGQHVDIDESDVGSLRRLVCRAYANTGGSDPACL